MSFAILTRSNLDGAIQIIIIVAIFVGFFAVVFTLNEVFGQTQNNISTPSLTTQTAPTPTTTTLTETINTEIATEQDVFNQFLTSLGVTGGGIVTGVGALWAKTRDKTKKIDQALRGTDFDNRDLMEVLNSFFEAAKNNPEKTPGQLLLLPAYKDKILLQKMIGEAWGLEYYEYMEWFNGRYMINKE